MNERGFALIASLWVVTLLSTIALAIGLEQRTRRSIAMNQVDETKARAAAESGLAHARAVLVRAAQSAQVLEQNRGAAALDAWSVLEHFEPDTIQLGDAWCVLRFEDAGARLNVNVAGEEELGRLFIALRVDAGTADRLSQAILDWRDADDAHRARGAEAADYLDDGLPVLPTNRPFDAIDELRHVKGMTAGLFALASPYLTVDGSGRVAIHAAPPEVLLALPGMTPEAAIVLLQLRRDGRRIGDISELGPYLSGGPRAELLRNTPELMRRIALESNEVVALAEGGGIGPLRVHARAVFVRSAGLIHQTDTRFE